jgi:hypothetical protein
MLVCTIWRIVCWLNDALSLCGDTAQAPVHGNSAAAANPDAGWASPMTTSATAPKIQDFVFIEASRR